ncbi:hypothetical protein DFH09DRAFT_1462015 [Mycena vulgaris]|nr:hypothetical protein DFH09DRAFT_1462015 [Mycena vulgaris]
MDHQRVTTPPNSSPVININIPIPPSFLSVAREVPVVEGEGSVEMKERKVLDRTSFVLDREALPSGEAARAEEVPREGREGIILGAVGERPLEREGDAECERGIDNEDDGKMPIAVGVGGVVGERDAAGGKDSAADGEGRGSIESQPRTKNTLRHQQPECSAPLVRAAFALKAGHGICREGRACKGTPDSSCGRGSTQDRV